MTSVAWSSAFVAQSLEVLFVYLAPEGAHHLRPIHAGTLRLGWPPERKPGEIVMEAIDRYALARSSCTRRRGGRPDRLIGPELRAQEVGSAPPS